MKIVAAFIVGSVLVQLYALWRIASGARLARWARSISARYDALTLERETTLDPRAALLGTGRMTPEERDAFTRDLRDWFDRVDAVEKERLAWRAEAGIR